MTASRWPMRWQRSSAWSCIAGVHSSSRNATFDARVSVMPCAATRVAPTISCGPSRSLERPRRSPRARSSASRPSRCSASGKRSSTACWTSRWRAKTTSGSPEARKSWIQRQRARRACRARPAAGASPSCARRSARSVAAIFAFSSQRSSGCSRSHSITSLLGEAVLALVVERDRHDDAGAWPAAGAAPRPSSRRTKQRRRRCQCRRSSVELALELAGEARARAEVLQAADDPQLADELLGVVEDRRAGQREAQPVGRDGLGAAGARPACAWPAGS